MDYAKLILDKRPIVQCITNIVTVNDCANALLAIGASPTMAHLVEEMSEIQSGCDALVCNLGATECYDAMLVAAKQANMSGHPMVIDPVGCGGSTYRREFFWKLVDVCRPACIRGNYSEIMALAYGKKTATGVDAKLDESVNSSETNIENAVMLLSKQTKSIVVASGIEDIVDGSAAIKVVTGGDVLMSRITGTGCMESSLLGAYLAVVSEINDAYDENNCACDEINGACNIGDASNISDKDCTSVSRIASVVSCCQRVKDAGKIAAEMTRERKAGTMTFREKFIDKLFCE